MSRPPTPGALGRTMRPTAWWLWAAGVAVAAACTTNPILLPLMALATGYVVAARRSVGQRSTPYRMALLLAVAVVLGALLVGAIKDGIGRSALLAAYEQGARPGLILLCIGAAISLSQPARLMVRRPRLMRLTPLAAAAQLRPAYRQLQVVRELRPDIERRSLLGAWFRTAGELTRRQRAALAERGCQHGTVDRWRTGEWCAVLAGAGIACCYLLCSFLGSGLTPDPWTMQAPTIPAVSALGLLLAVLPAHLTPAPPRPVAPHAGHSRPLAAA